MFKIIEYLYIIIFKESPNALSKLTFVAWKL